MTIDFTSISLPNLIVLALTCIIGLIVIKKLGIVKLGPVEIDKGYEGLTINALVLKRLDNIDIKLHDDVSMTTNKMMRHFLPQDNSLCYYGRRAIMESVLIPLRKRASCNHFTTHLSSKENKENYKYMIMNAIEDQYIDIRPISSKSVCSVNPELQEWNDVKEFYSNLVDDWISRVGSLTKAACQEKIKVYDEALRSVKNNKYWSKVFTECKEKNLKYIESIV